MFEPKKKNSILNPTVSTRNRQKTVEVKLSNFQLFFQPILQNYASRKLDIMSSNFSIVKSPFVQF